ncbi:MAG: hypothetical protein OEX19_00925, partial [Gammaproteobacteria bacterium]|nr:hypothetical protein [Gammaproteobacteria bacterium]
NKVCNQHTHCLTGDITMKKFIAVAFVAFIATACANTENTDGMKMNDDMGMKKETMKDSMSHDTMKKDDMGMSDSMDKSSMNDMSMEKKEMKKEMKKDNMMTDSGM